MLASVVNEIFAPPTGTVRGKVVELANPTGSGPNATFGVAVVFAVTALTVIEKEVLG